MKAKITSVLLLLIAFTYAQVGIGTTTPASTLDVIGAPASTTTVDGLLIPRLTGDELRAKNAVYLAAQNGAMVYVTAADTAPAGKTVNVVRVGLYTYNAGAGEWQTPTPNNIYTGDGALAGNRIVTQGGNSINFAGAGNKLFSGAGNVGIGTATPSKKLTIENGSIRPAAGNSSDAGVYFPENIGGGSSDDAFIRYYVKSGENTKLAIGTNDNPEDDIAFFQFGAERMTIINGNVGIGTTAPSERLDVAGNVRFSGALMPNNAAGTTGQILTSAGSGVAPTWQTSSGVSSNIYTADGTLAGNRTVNQGTNSINFSGAGNKFFTGGNVGIGTTTPAERLDITGGNVFIATQGNYLRFFHPNQFNSDDGKIGARTFAEGLNIVGVRTTLADPRKTFIFGNVGFSQALMPNDNPGVSGQVLTSAGPNAAPTWTNAPAATTNTLGSSINTITSTVNGVAATAPAVNSVANTSAANTLGTTVNGVVGATVNIINSNTTSINGSNQLVTTVNGVASTALTLPANNIYTTDGTLTGNRIVTQGANSITFSGAGIKSFTGGNVGIGTTTPNALLHVGTLGITPAETNVSLFGSSNNDVIGIVGSAFAANLNFYSNNLAARRATIQTASVSSGGNLNFYTASAAGGAVLQRATILENGNVGIGVPTPTALLHVGSLGITPAETNVSNFGNRTGDVIGVVGDPYGANINFYTDNSNARRATIRATPNLSGGDLNFFTLPAAGGGVVSRATITENGNVGIGITNPSVKLEVIGTTKSDSYIFPSPAGDNSPVITARTVPVGQGASNQKTELILFHSNDNANGAGPDQITLRAPFLSFQTYNDSGVGDINNNAGFNERMVVTSTGNVGIGTNAPNAKLQVNGTFALTTATSGTANSVVLQNAGTFTPPAASVNAGVMYIIRNTSTTTDLSVATTIPFNSATAGTIAVTPSQGAITIVSDGTNWYRIQ